MKFCWFLLGLFDVTGLDSRDLKAKGRPVRAADQGTNPFSLAAAPIGRVAREKQGKTAPGRHINLRFGS
jgi:hypothetical protein